MMAGSLQDSRPEGWDLPVAQALTEPVLMAGMPRDYAIAMGTIAVVLGLLPVLGVPLPLISAGGSALVTTLLGIGIVLSFARLAPAAVPAPGGRLR